MTIQQYHLAVSAIDCLPLLKSYYPDMRWAGPIQGWHKSSPIEHRMDAPIFRKIVGRADFEQFPWKHFRSNGIVYGVSVERYDNDRLCIIPATSFDLAYRQVEGTTTTARTIRVSSKDDPFFFIAGVWQNEIDAPEKGFAPLVRPAVGELEKYVKFQPWILDWDEWTVFLDMPKGQLLRPRSNPRQELDLAIFD